MKIYLDDVRPTPDGYTRCYWPEEVTKLLEEYGPLVEEVSLDHDLGDDPRTGYDVLTWIEERVMTTDYVPPVIKIHSANAVGRLRMSAALKQIEKIIDNRGG